MKINKKKIKKYIPQRILYLLDLKRTFSEYCKMKRENIKVSKPNLKFYTDDETIDMIINEKKSLARFGDGEFMWMTGESMNSFQDYSVKFSKELRKAFQANNDNLLIGIPIGIFDSSGCNLNAKLHWEIIKNNFYRRLSKIVDENRVYCNASITRPYIDYKSRKYSKKCFENIRRIWDNQNILIVEGQDTKLGIGNDLFNNAKSIRRIICPSINAYEKIDEIEKSILNNYKNGDIVLGALGPTASILAYRMSLHKIQFIDIGHIDIEYMWYLKRAIVRIPIDGKYVNESGEKCDTEFYSNNKEYNNSIIDKI